jgi:hypothetical protein
MLLMSRRYHISSGCYSRACRDLGCEPFRAALTIQLRSLTGMEPSLAQKDFNGRLQWVVEPLR